MALLGDSRIGHCMGQSSSAGMSRRVSARSAGFVTTGGAAGFAFLAPVRARLPGLPLASRTDAGCGFGPGTASLPIATFEANVVHRLAPVVNDPIKKRIHGQKGG